MESFSWWSLDNPGGNIFVVFGPAHWVSLGILGVLTLAFLLIRQPSYPLVRRFVRYTMAAALLGNDLLMTLWAWDHGLCSLDSMLPLHLCSLSVYLSIAALVTLHRPAYEFLYFMGIGGGLPSLITPYLAYGFPHFRFFEYFICHILIVAAPLYLTLAEGYRPCWRSVGRIIVVMNLYLACVALVNYGLGSNYLYLCERPEGTLADYLGSGFWYVPSMEVLGVLVVVLLYVPFAFYDRRRINHKKHEKHEMKNTKEICQNEEGRRGTEGGPLFVK
jgi:hypothetical integral membrane protein (TIGR02206 family)